MDDLAENDSGNAYIKERNEILKDTPYSVVRQAWFILSHLLLDAGSDVVHMGCGDGRITYALAALAPHLNFTGVDKSKRVIKDATGTHNLPNLEYKIGDVSSDLFEPESCDAVINNYILHEVFSNARYNEQIVSDTLRKHFKILRNNGLMFIQDYARPPHGQFVLMEMHAAPSYGEELADLSEVDLLIWYAEHAQPKQDPGCGGFFLEELEPRFPKTRLFRLPYKWAYEFIMRKDNREKWEDDLPFEYTFYTIEEFRHELRALGARVQYSAPHWNEEFTVRNFDGHFRLFRENGDPLGDPATSFIAVAQKLPDRTSLNISERRISGDNRPGPLVIKTYRNAHNGDIVDVITREKELAEILPYRITEEGRLNIFLHDGIARGLVNAVPRSGANIDGRQWSGHMLEALATDLDNILMLGEIDTGATISFAKDYLGLSPERESVLDQGPHYYPDPNTIEERVHTFYLKVKEAKTPLVAKTKILHTQRFSAKGLIREFSAQQVLDAIAVGLIPNARLELQILSLFHHLNMKAENWISKDISIVSGEITANFGIRNFLRNVSNTDKRFREIKDHAGQFRTINSIFVEEGQSQGGRTGIASETLDFAISDEKTINTAVVLPITRSTKGDLHAGFLVKHMPVPQRFEGNGMSISAPQFDIPREITNHRMLKQFIAEKFGVTPDMVLKLGESYFSHIGVTPQRIHPLAITAPPQYFTDPNTKFMPFYQYMLMWRNISKESHFMTTLARAYRYMPAHLKSQAKKEVLLMVQERFKAAQPDWSLPASFEKPALRKPDEPEKENRKENATAPLEKDKPLRDPYQNLKKQKKEKKDKKKRGLEAKTQAQTEAQTDAVLDADEVDDTALEKKAALHPTDLDLVEEFEKEIRAIREAMDEGPDNGPKPEKW